MYSFCEANTYYPKMVFNKFLLDSAKNREVTILDIFGICSAKSIV